jgi:hypothetical protein
MLAISGSAAPPKPAIYLISEQKQGEIVLTRSIIAAMQRRFARYSGCSVLAHQFYFDN